MSPVLFGVFIETLLRDYLLDTSGLDLPSLGRSVAGSSESSGSCGPTLVPPLLYADDLSLLATSPEGLQKQLDRLQLVSSRYGMTINVPKTKLLATGPKAPTVEKLPPTTLAGEPLEWVEEFRYLGLLVHRRHGFAHAASSLHAQGLAKYHALIRQCRSRGVEDTISLNLLFDSLVTSILGYGAPIWGPDVFAPSKDASGALRPVDCPPEGSTAMDYERLQRRFMRYLLGVPQRTCHLALHLETARPPMALQLYKHTAKFLAHLMDDVTFPPDSLVRRALASSADYSITDSWLRRFQAWAAALGSDFDLSSCIPPELSSAFAVTATASTRTRSAVALSGRRAPPSLLSSLQVAYSTWSTSLSSRTASDPVLSSFPVSPALSSWKRRPLACYVQFPHLSDRSLLARCRLRLEVGGLPLFTSSSTDLRTLDPDPFFATDLPALASSFAINPALPISDLLRSPPATFPSFIRTLIRYLQLRTSHLPRPDLIRLFPQLPQ